MTLRDGSRWRAVADQIAHDVQAGLLPAGTWLRQIDLAERFGCSRSDVRRALDELVARRLVQHELNRGYRIFVLEAKLIAELRELRAILEVAVADRIYDRADAAALAGLEILATRFEEHVRTGTLLDQYAANLDFHMALLDLCPNAELAQAVRDTRARLPSALIHQWSARGWIEQSVRDHAALIAALRAHDRDAFRAAVIGHLRHGSRADAV